MSGRYFGFVLLVLFPAELHAQTAAQPCQAPRLVKGFLVPEQELYSHGFEITYSCDNGRKPAVEGWWATSTCQNGVWSHLPQCIDNNACIPPEIPHGEYTATSSGWHTNNDVIRVKCDKGYKHKGYAATSTCVNGTWSSLPVCEESEDACGVPAQVPHAVIVNQEYQELFEVDSQVLYECEHGYSIGGTHTNKSVICLGGIWSQGPDCTTSGSSGGGLHTALISTCGDRPIVEHADVVESGDTFLRYQCNDFYTEVGSEEVMCFSDGTWSEAPTCRSTYCSVDTERYSDLESVGVHFIKYGEIVKFKCERKSYWLSDHFSEVQCNNGRVTKGKCCSWLNKLSC